MLHTRTYVHEKKVKRKSLVSNYIIINDKKKKKENQSHKESKTENTCVWFVHVN